jgi:hypothetical protein
MDKPKKPKCEGGSPICAGELMKEYKFDDEKVCLCMACVIYLRLKVKGDRIVGVK